MTRRTGSTAAARVLADAAAADLAFLDALDLDLHGESRLGRRFVGDVKRTLRALRAQDGTREFAAEDHLVSALRQTLDRRARARGLPIDGHALAHVLHARFPVEWRYVIDGHL